MEADYVIVGAGSAGCIMAYRLSAAGASVVLLEAGPRDWHPMIHVPAGMKMLISNPSVNWNFMTEADPSLGGRRVHWPRGKVLGGCSAINGMAYVRGNPEDFNHWSRLGCDGWSYEEVLPFFKRTERYAGGDDRYRGRDGLLPVADYDPPMDVTRSFVEAAQQCGFAYTDDINGERQEGVGYFQMTRKGRFRASTATTFLQAARGRPNLRVETEAHATALVFEGKRCVGVNYTQRAKARSVRARKEVILAAGAIGSPHLLQVSGVGDPEHLRAIGVRPRHALAGVGRNLSDHPRVAVAYRMKELGSLNELTRGWRLAREIMRWVSSGTGALTYGVTSAAVFCRSDERAQWPDLQLLFTPVSFDPNRVGALERAPGVTVNVCPVRPDSRGTVLARSADAAQAPAIQANYFDDPRDMGVTIAGIRIAREIMAMPALRDVVAAEIAPQIGVADDAAIERYVRATVNSVYHPVGTCKMGADDSAVVDSRLQVRGLAGLRVADASVMPCLTTGNTAAPTMMIAEKASAMIIENMGVAS